MTTPPFPPAAVLAAQIIKVDRAYATAGVTRERNPEQVSNFLEVCGLPRNPLLSFCSAGGSYGVLRAYCDVVGIPYTADNAVAIFKAQIPVVEAHWCRISASCEEVRQWAIKHGKWLAKSDIPTGMLFKPGWVALMNFETTGPESHHYGTVISGAQAHGTVTNIEFNTSSGSGSQAHGGSVAIKTRSVYNSHFRGFVRTY